MPIDGDRTFDLIWGSVTALMSLAVASPMLWWILPKHRRSVFGSQIDPGYGLQFGYGVFAMGMAFTDLLCRVIPHGELEYVHPAFALITLALVAGFGPRLIVLARRPQNGSTV